MAFYVITSFPLLSVAVIPFRAKLDPMGSCFHAESLLRFRYNPIFSYTG